MKKLILWLVLLCASHACLALAPYVHAAKLAEAELLTQLALIEKKLTAEGFTVIGRHAPKGLPGRASLVVTDRAVLESVRTIGGSAMHAVGINNCASPRLWARAGLLAVMCRKGSWRITATCSAWSASIQATPSLAAMRALKKR